MSTDSSTVSTVASTSNSNANGLQEMAKCIICLETYTEYIRAPILTSCGHAFCRECVKKATVNHVFKCFECREMTLCESGLKINISVLQCLQMMNLLAPEDSIAHLTAWEKSNFVVVDEKQKLVDNITMALTAYVIETGDEYSCINDANDILQTAEYNVTIAFYSQNPNDYEENECEENAPTNTTIDSTCSETGSACNYILGFDPAPYSNYLTAEDVKFANDFLDLALPGQF
uniref:RING-type domain-containing protein n=1 Tax=Panagrellus redivivus TaxID=6233 RepID=A0A7E4VJI7_PANRE